MRADRRGRNIDLLTLAITAVASAAAAYVASKVWAPGTLPSAAFTPVLVALLKETLQRPTEVVARAVPMRSAVRGASTSSGEAPPRSHGAPRSHATGDEEWTPVARSGTSSRPGRSSSRTSKQWRLAVITGLLGFVVCALALTVPELVAGQSASGGGRQTTLFGGHAKKQNQRSPTTTAPTRTATTPQTVTVPPPKAAPAPTTTTPAPGATTPVPAPAQPAPPAPAPP